VTPRAAVEAFYDRVWNRRETTRHRRADPAGLYVPRLARPTMTGHTAFQAYVEQVTTALADYRCIILDVVCEGERAFARNAL
jgi:hypothetical protein